MSAVQNGWVTVRARGDDAEAFSNLLRKKYGEIPARASSVERWDLLRGYVTGAGKVGYGVYVDLGILEPQAKDALYPLHRMRAQLSESKQMSAREILTENALVDGFPVKVVVTEMDGEKVGVELDDSSRERFQNWREHPWDRVVAVGLTKKEAINTLRGIRLEDDVVDVEPLSLFVQSLVLKIGTDAPGVIARIGPRLRGVSLAAYTVHKKIG